MRFHKIAIITLFILVLGGCRTVKSSNNGSSTMKPSLTPSMESKVTSTPHIIGKPTISRKSPTITLTRTVTKVQTPTPTTLFDRLEYETIKGNESVEMEQTQIAEFPNNGGSGQTDGLLSPNGEWIFRNRDNLEDIILKSKSGREIRINGTDLDPNGLAIWNTPIQWSSDSNYLWVAYGNTTGGRMDCDIGSYYLGLFRIDLQTGKVTATLSLDENGYVFQFSPSGRYLAFSQANSRPDGDVSFFTGISKIIVMDLITGKKVEYKDPAQLSGSMLFSPDETRLAFSSQEEKPAFPPPEEARDFICIYPKLRIIDINSGNVETFYNGTGNFEYITDVPGEIEFSFNETNRAPIELLFWDEPGLIWFRFFPEQYEVLNIEKNKISTVEP
jgi:hypothetical protein